MSDETERDTEAELVRAWRVAAAMGLRFEWAEAVKLADSDVDMHKLAELLNRGATPNQALRILL